MDKLPNVEVMKSAKIRAQLDAMPLATRSFDTDLREPTPILPQVVGSITFAPDRSAPCYDPEKVVLQAEVERLREGNRRLLDENNELKRLLKVGNK